MKKIFLTLTAIIYFVTCAYFSHAQASKKTLERIGAEWAEEADRVAWSGPPQQEPATPKVLGLATYYDTPIQPNTRLHIRLRGDEPELDRPGVSVEVSTNGTIKYPYIGEVEVVNMTEEQVAKKIEMLLQKDFVISPEVYVSIKESPGYWLLGSVTAPGRYEMLMDREITLAEAIEFAGGFREQGDISLFRNDWTAIRVTRTEEGERRLYEFKLDDIPETFVVKPSDLILCRYGEMKDLGSYYIFGQVANPGKYPIVSDDYSAKKLFRFSTTLNKYITILGASNVIDAIATAEGLTDKAARNWVWLRRKENGKWKRYRIPVGHIIYKGDMSTNIRVKDGDVISVSESWF